MRSFFEGLSVFLHSAEFAGAARTTASAFTRQRKLPLPRLVACLLNALRSGLQNELDAFCDFVLAQTDTPSKSALCQARQRLAPAALLGLLHRSAHLLEAAVAAPRWHGRRVLAIDGTTLRVPDTPECRVHFGGMRTAGGRFRPLARASLLFDVGRGSVLDAQLRDYHCDERSVAAGHLAHLGAGDLGLTDRGFPAYAWFAAVVGRGADFCSRITAQSWTAARDFVRSPDTERWVELAPKRGARTAPLSVRLLKFLRPNGQFLVLVTSVTDPDIPAAAFAALYHGRWRIEENFKLIKSRLHTENWTGISPHTTEQDFYLRLVQANCTAALGLAAQPPAPWPETYPAPAPASGWVRRPNLTYLFGLLRHHLARWLLGIAPESVLALWCARGQRAAAFNLTRPNRSNPRNMGVRLKGFSTAYKGLA